MKLVLIGFIKSVPIEVIANKKSYTLELVVSGIAFVTNVTWL